MLPIVPQASLKVLPIDWGGLPRRFLNPGELEVLIALVRSVQSGYPREMVEFGCNNGRTAKAILDNVPSLVRYVGVDVPKEYIPSKSVQQREWTEPGVLARRDPRFELWVYPRGSLDVSAQRFTGVDVVFIDGDHSRDAVIHDSHLAHQIVLPGGLIIWHDYHNLGTVDVKEVLDQYFMEGVDIKHVENTWFAYHKVH